MGALLQPPLIPATLVNHVHHTVHDICLFYRFVRSFIVSEKEAADQRLAWESGYCRTFPFLGSKYWGDETCSPWFLSVMYQMLTYLRAQVWKSLFKNFSPSHLRICGFILWNFMSLLFGYCTSHTFSTLHTVLSVHAPKGVCDTDLIGACSTCRPCFCSRHLLYYSCLPYGVMRTCWWLSLLSGIRWLFYMSIVAVVSNITALLQADPAEALLQPRSYNWSLLQAC